MASNQDKKLIGLVVAVVLLSILVVFQFYHQKTEAEKQLNQERYMRMVAEEGLQKVKTEVSSLGTDLDRIRKKSGNLEKMLDDTKAMNSDLKKQMDDVAKQKDSLQKRVEELIHQPKKDGDVSSSASSTAQ